MDKEEEEQDLDVQTMDTPALATNGKGGTKKSRIRTSGFRINKGTISYLTGHAISQPHHIPYLIQPSVEFELHGLRYLACINNIILENANHIAALSQSVKGFLLCTELYRKLHSCWHTV